MTLGSTQQREGLNTVNSAHKRWRRNSAAKSAAPRAQGESVVGPRPAAIGAGDGVIEPAVGRRGVDASAVGGGRRGIAWKTRERNNIETFYASLPTAVRNNSSNCPLIHNSRQFSLSLPHLVCPSGLARPPPCLPPRSCCPGWPRRPRGRWGRPSSSSGGNERTRGPRRGRRAFAPQRQV